MLRTLAILTSTAVSLVVATAAHADTLLFLSVPGIPGDSIFEQAADEIQGISYSFGIAPAKATKYGTVGVCAPGQTKPTFSEFCVVKRTDIASPKLFVAAASATQFPLVTISVFRETGNLPQLVARYQLSNAFVSSLRADANTAADAPTEQVCFRFNRAQVTTTRATVMGGTVSETAGFDACQASPF